MLDLIRQEASLQQSLAYDYNQVAEADRPVIIAAALEIKPRLKRASEDLVEVGKQLTAVKEKLPHGSWEDWLRVEFELSDRTAQNFMNVAGRFDGKSEIISLLSSTVAYQLAAPSTPAAAVAEVLASAQASGKSPSVAQTKAVIAKHKPAPAPEYWAPIWRIQNGVRAWVRAYCPAGATPAEWLAVLSTVKNEEMDGPARFALFIYLRETITAEDRTQVRWSDTVQACNNLIDQFRTQTPPLPPVTAQMEAELAPPAAPSRRFEIEALIMLYSDAVEHLAAYSRITGLPSKHLISSFEFLVSNLKHALSKEATK